MIRRLSHKVQQDQETIATYTEQLTTLDDAWDTLAKAVKSATSSHHQGDKSIQQHHLERTERRVQKTIHGYTELAKRMHDLDEHIKANPDAVGTARVRLELDDRDRGRRICLRWLMLGKWYNIALFILSSPTCFHIVLVTSLIGLVYYYSRS